MKNQHNCNQCEYSDTYCLGNTKQLILYCKHKKQNIGNYNLICDYFILKNTHSKLTIAVDNKKQQSNYLGVLNLKEFWIFCYNNNNDLSNGQRFIHGLISYIKKKYNITTINEDIICGEPLFTLKYNYSSTFYIDESCGGGDGFYKHLLEITFEGNTYVFKI